jgi:hypothetical protein
MLNIILNTVLALRFLFVTLDFPSTTNDTRDRDSIPLSRLLDGVRHGCCNSDDVQRLAVSEKVLRV